MDAVVRNYNTTVGKVHISIFRKISDLQCNENVFMFNCRGEQVAVVVDKDVQIEFYGKYLGMK